MIDDLHVVMCGATSPTCSLFLLRPNRFVPVCCGKFIKQGNLTLYTLLAVSL